MWKDMTRLFGKPLQCNERQIAGSTLPDGDTLVAMYMLVRSLRCRIGSRKDRKSSPPGAQPEDAVNSLRWKAIIDSIMKPLSTHVNNNQQ